jgi:acyl dehydratase
MPIMPSLVGQATGTISHSVDARWMMAFAASIGDFNPCFLDTAAHRIIAHPLFPVCLEWPAILNARQLPGSETLTDAERARSIHAAHDLHLYQPIHADQQLHTQATIIGVETIKPGISVTTRLDTYNDAGHPVCRTYQLTILRDVRMIGGSGGNHEDRQPSQPSPADSSVKEASFDIPIPEGLAHTYSECARIWNPIHTDRAAALATGLPDIILHGTATLAMAVSRLVNNYLDGDATRVVRIGGRFAAMVLMPNTLCLTVHGHQVRTLRFSVLTSDGTAAVRDGFLVHH